MRRAQVVLGVLLSVLPPLNCDMPTARVLWPARSTPLPIFTRAALRRASIMSTPLLGMAVRSDGAATAARQPLAAAAVLRVAYVITAPY